MTRTRVISLDLDDTLWPVAPTIEAAERALIAWLREQHPRAAAGQDVESMRALRAQAASDHPQLAHDFTFLRRHALARQFEAAGYAARDERDAAVDAAFEVFFAARNRVTLFPDVRPTLERLRARYRIFALSNGNADLARCGLSDLFDGHVCARRAGAAKPDERIFRELLRVAGVAAGEVLHVGDDPHADVAGAVGAGIAAVWINREQRPWPAELAPPPRTVTTLAQLVAHLPEE